MLQTKTFSNLASKLPKSQQVRARVAQKRPVWKFRKRICPDCRSYTSFFFSPPLHPPQKDWALRLCGIYSALILSKCAHNSRAVPLTTHVCGDTNHPVNSALRSPTTTHPNDPSIIIPACVVSAALWLGSRIKSCQQIQPSRCEGAER